MKAAWLLFSAVIGLAIASQPHINAELGRRLQSPLGAACFSLALSLALLLAAAALWQRDVPAFSGTTGAPFWIWLGGLSGALYVGGALFIAPKIGTVSLFTWLIAGQVAGALAIDYFGLFGAARMGVTPTRLLGVAMVLGGALLAQRA